VDLIYHAAGIAEAAGPAGTARLLEQAAGPHAAQLGVGMDALRAEGRAWMLLRLGLAARRWPEPGEAVEVITWPSRRTAGARAWREFEILSASGEPLVQAASVWLMVDLRSRKPVRLPRFLLELNFPARDTGIEFAAPAEVAGEPTHTHQRTVGPEDLDINEHVNNAAYIAWAETLVAWRSWRRLQVDYASEARIGDRIHLETWEAEEQAVQRIHGPHGLCASLQWRRGARPT